jgi:hypothetical protein
MGLSVSLGFGIPGVDCPVGPDIGGPGMEWAADVTDVDAELDGGVVGGFGVLLAGLEPGPATMAVLASVDPDSVDEASRHLMIVAWQRCEAWLTAASLAAVCAAMRPTRVVVHPDWLREEVGLSLRMSPGAAQARIDLAQTLDTVLPATWAALAAGDITARHAQVITDLCRGLDPATAARVEAAVLPGAVEQTPAEFRRCVKRAKIAAAPDAAAADAAVAARGRDVRLYPAEDGMAVLWALLPAADALTLYNALDLQAHAARDQHRDTEHPGDRVDERGIGAWRADVLTGWGHQWITDSTLPTRHGKKVHAQIVIDLATALGLAEHPAELPGYGPLPPEVARHLIGDATWRRFLTDPATGHLLDIGSTSYRPPARLAEFIITKERHCRFPGCTRAATHCDIDHTIPYHRGGTTTRRNCHCLCRRHHQLKTFGNWLLEILADDTLQWTSPCGRTYLVPPQRFLPTGQPDHHTNHHDDHEYADTG